MDEAVFWAMIENAWSAHPSVAAKRRGLLDMSSPNRQALAAEIEEGCGAMIDTLRGRLSELEERDLLEFDRILERTLHRLDRRDIHRVVDGSDDGFLYCRGFIVAVGRECFEAVDSDPPRAVTGVWCEPMAYVSMRVMDDRFGADAWTPSEISRESFTNATGWRS